MTEHLTERMPPGYDTYMTEQPRSLHNCPHCGSPVDPERDVNCPTCGAEIEGHFHDFNAGEPDSGDHWGHLTSKFHLMGAGEERYVHPPHPQLPGGGQYNDHSFVNEMSMEQRGAHQQEVNFAIDQINKATTQAGAGAVDDSFLDNLKNQIANQFLGGDVAEAQTIVDEAMRQSNNQDGTLDKQAPQDPAQAAQPDPSMPQGVGQGPEPVPVSNGAFAKTAAGIVGEVTDQWSDMYGDEWVELTDDNGYRSGHLISEVTAVEHAPADTRLDEIVAFLHNSEPQEFTAGAVKARITNLKLARQEIRELIANNRVAEWQKAALDQVDTDTSVELLDLTNHLPQLMAEPVSMPDTTPMAAGGVWQPFSNGVDELEVEQVAPDYDIEQIEQAIPESAAIFAEENVGATDLAGHAASYIDKFTNGHPPEVRAQHRARFVEAVTKAAASRRSEPTPKTASTEEPLANHDGPAEALFVGGIYG